MSAMRVRPRSKYGAVKTTVDGITFDSKGEATRYGELKLLEKAGEIEDLCLQPKFALKVALTTGTMRGATKALTNQYPVIGYYVGDFEYYDLRTCTRVVEDYKGFRTALYLWKKKHVEAQYDIVIRET